MASHGDRTLFGDVPEKNVYFLIDTSGSMYHQLGFVKSHLIEVLTRRAILSQDTMFNIIQFNEHSNKWAESLVHCNTETTNIASQWISSLTCGTSTNTMTALIQAFNDPGVEAVYVVTDGLPDQRPAIILEKLSSMSHSVPVHCIYLKGTYSDPAACEFLRDLALQTKGSFHIVKLSEYLGKVEQVLPILPSNQRYENRAYRQNESKPYIDLNTPPSSGRLNRFNDNSRLMSSTHSHPDSFCRTPEKNHVLDSSCRTRFDPKVLDYADALIQARNLARSSGIHCSSTPLASSVMKGVKVLARLDRDGLFYLGNVNEQGSNDSFVIKLESCPGLRKPALQEISVHNMIAFKDAFRQNISLGDKVLAPWQNDGRYGPGTVLDGFERRDTQIEGDDDGELLVTFFNGETASLKRGIAIRIPEQKFNQLSFDIQLPESQRRKQSVQRHSVSRPTRKTVWEDERRELQLENEKLKQKIDDQIKENTNLIRALDLNITNSGDVRKESPLIGKATSCDLRDSPVIGTATSYDLRYSPVIGRTSLRDFYRDYDSGVFSDEESSGCSEDLTVPYGEISPIDDTVKKHNKDYDLSITPRFSLPRENVAAKTDRNVEPIKPWRCSSSAAASATQPRFRETVLKKPREPGDKLTERPSHEEYQTVAGVSFPAGTDRKFGAKRQKWHPYHQFGDGKKTKENVSAIWERKYLKHSEYQDASGVKFPSATDKKFTRTLDPNWTPETALRNAERSKNWEDGLGHGDAEKNARYANKLERIRTNKRRYFKDIEDKVAVEEGKEAKRIEFRRNKTAEREEDMADADAEQDRLKTSRLETKRAKQAEILQHEKDRTDKAEKWKTDRIDAMKERQVKFAEMEDGHELKNDSKKARRQAYLRMKEHERREEFHEKLRKEWRTEDERAEYYRRQSEASRERQSTRQQEADRAKHARLSAKQERREKYRASILP